MKTKLKIAGSIILFFLVVSLSLKGQVSDKTGQIIKPKIFDQYGKTYNVEDVIIKRTRADIVVTAGFFELTFVDPLQLPNIGFFDASSGTARRNVVRQVFTDLSQLIVRPTVATSLVKIQVLSQNNPTSWAIGSGQSLLAQLNDNSGIIDAAVWKTITGGADAFAQFGQLLYGDPSMVFYHGILTLNFRTDWNFNTNLSIYPVAAQFDLYSITLHEAMHMLGIGSYITSTGASWFAPKNYYSRWDMHLRRNTPTQSMLLSTNNCYIQSFIANTGDLSSGCQNIRFVGIGGLDLPVLATGGCTDGSSLSHFDRNCTPNPNYIMQPNISAGENPARRSPVQEEVNVLCELDYQTSGTYGTTSSGLGIYHTFTTCGERIAGVNDFGYSTNYKVPITISNVLNNDNNGTILPARFECLEIITSGAGNNTNLSATQGISFTYTPPTGFAGNAILRYIPVNTSGSKRGNITYIVIYVNPPQFDCNPNQCNLVCNGDFTGFLVGMPSPSMDPYSNFRITDPLGNSPGIENFNGNQYCSISSYSHFEGIVYHLIRPIAPGCTTTIKFKASRNYNGGINGNIILRILGSFNPPCVPNTLNNTDCAGGGGACTAYTHTCMANVTLTNDATGSWPSITNPNFIAFTRTYVNNTGSDINYIMFTGAEHATGFILIDDIDVRSNCEKPLTITSTVTSPNSCSGGTVSINYQICSNTNNANPITLQVAALPTGLSFASGGNFNSSGQCVIPANGLYGTIDETFCTNLVLNLNISPNTSGGPINVTLNAVSNNACFNSNTNSNVTTITLSPKPCVSLMGSYSPGRCAGSCSNISAFCSSFICSGNYTCNYTYKWSTGAVSYSINVCPTITTNYTLTVTTAQGCTASTGMTIFRNPKPEVSVSGVPTCDGCNYTASPSNGSSPYTYLWSNGAITQTTYSPNANGCPNVVVTDANGCTGSPYFYPICTGYPCKGSHLSGITENTESVAFNIYPNPTNDNITIESENITGNDIYFEIYGLLGNKVANYKLTDSKTTVSVKDLDAGIYLYKVVVNKVPIKTEKLIITK
ncbi:MAG: T9SS type A sorting domain-containing protein [Bacteroidales bacterium]|jgi:hypothetical protein